MQTATTDVGSLPLTDDFEGAQKNFGKAVEDKLSLGLDFPCYPQLPGTKESPMNMYLQFLAPLAKEGRGLSIEGEELHLEGEIEVPSHPLGVERAEYFVNFASQKRDSVHLIGLKGCLTGPFTLASAIDRADLFTSGVSKREVVAKLSELVSASCRRLEDLGFGLISIDEPILSVLLGDDDRILRKLFGYGEDFVVDSLDGILGNVGVCTGIHVCGVVTPMVKRVLLDSNVDIVDHEFCEIPRNLVAYTKNELQSRDKLLALGCVSSTRPTVEGVQTIKRRIEAGLDHFGQDILIKPDCGFGGLLGAPSAYDICLRKLGNLIRAKEELSKERILESGASSGK